MDKRTEVFAVAQYYNIPYSVAYARISNMTEEEIEVCTEWFLDKQEA